MTGIEPDQPQTSIVEDFQERMIEQLLAASSHHVLMPRSRTRDRVSVVTASTNSASNEPMPSANGA